MLSHLQIRIRHRYPRLRLVSAHVVAPVHPSPAIKPKPSSRLKMEAVLKIAIFAIKDPHAITYAAMCMAVESVASKVKSLMQSKPTQQTVLPRLRRRCSNLCYDFSSVDLEDFFVRELEYSPRWTNNAIIPLVHGLLRESDSDLLFTRNLDLLDTLGFPELSILNDTARSLPHRQRSSLWNLFKKWFFVKRGRSYPQTLQTARAVRRLSDNFIAEAKDVQRFTDSPASLQGVRKLFAEPFTDYVDIAALWRQLVRTEMYRLIYQTVEVQYFDDGAVVVQKQKSEKEQFGVVRDVKFLFEPEAGDEVLEDVSKLFREKKVKIGLKQRFKNSWNSFTSLFRRSNASEEKNGGWQRLKAAIRVKRV